ncbi:unnamed protein product [Rodentolepis nana]|uniref:SH2 domain-containing protein n=1 Tax=Rodentolepis nana TaxID=102285 RepID=A0A0R3T7M9_RODNA|nr:unnamed protein product [Rodentolepis nana]
MAQVQKAQNARLSDFSTTLRRTQPKRILMKDLVIKKGLERPTGYFFMVVTSPMKRESDPVPENFVYQGLFSPEIESAPWVIVRDRYHKDQMITFPITLCGGVYESLQTMVSKRNGDWSFDVTKLQKFQLMESILNNFIDCPNETVQNEISADADSKDKSDVLSDDEKKRVWLRSGPVNPPEPKADLPPHKRTTYLRVYEELVPNLLAFLLDIKTRYSQRDVSPEKAVSMLSDSGERRFFFDVRNTRYGYRLHISQVSNKNRMVIGIPLESVVMARNCLNEVIENYSLAEDNDRATLRKYCQNVILVRRNRRSDKSCSGENENADKSTSPPTANANGKKIVTGNKRS